MLITEPKLHKMLTLGKKLDESYIGTVLFLQLFPKF